ncbi:unnamed protein product [Phaedon cochleariae]|uniref:63 kDa sperm flagellar membrane protein n=1 Tax=Phaedon cochleariae TaxID=80249 RepID=A0A9P0DLC4_PHACE|nr:unnamed protein product [Phaedon cochleariae]
MPKVETSLNKWGKHITKINVSNKIGDKKYRYKRDLPEINKKRRRVIKKLVRVQPLTNATFNEESMKSEEKFLNDITTRRYRKRLRIKKKKKRLLIPSSTTNFEETESIQPTVKQRRKIIITKKRILPSTNKTVTPVLPQDIASTNRNPVFLASAEEYTRNILAGQNNYESSSYNENSFDSFETDTDDEQNDSEEDYGEDEDDNYDSDEYYDNEDNFTEAIPIVTIRNDLSLERDSEESSISETKYIENEEEPDTASEMNIQEEVKDTNFIHPSGYSDDENIDQSTFHQDLPEYEPFFPELSESLDAPVLLLKTTVLSSTELLTNTVTQSRLRTYTFVVTRVSGSEEIVTSTTEVRPQVQTTVLTETLTKFTTLTLLDFDATETLTDFIPTLDNPQPDDLDRAKEGRSFSEEARYNLATRVMSNGVEVIVAGDKTTSPSGKQDPKRFLSVEQKHVTLKPSTLTDQVLMLLPQETSKIDISNSDQFITKTCLTTFTYITTYLEGSTTTVSSHEQVVSNVATEARETGKILPTPTVGITLTQNTNLSVGVFHTTYTYLNTILDGEQPLIISSEHTVANTVTAPNDYFSLLQPSETVEPTKDTNTYYSTIGLEKTLFEGDKTSVISTKEVVTQVVITESVPPRATSVMTSYIALDMEENPLISSTDVLKTYFVTYTYFKTVMEGGKEVVKTDISTASDVVTEQLYILPKKKTMTTTQSPVKQHTMSHLSRDKMQIQVAKSYFTTFTYYTTLLREENKATSTIVSSRTSVVKNLVTETIDPSLLDEKYLTKINDAIGEGSKSVVMQASLQNGHTVEITAYSKKPDETILPSKVIPIERTKSPETFMNQDVFSVESSSPSVITGSTIIFVDDDPFTHLASTPVLTTLKTAITKIQTTSSAIQNTKSSVEIIKTKPSTKRNKSKNQVSPTKTKTSPNKSKTTSSLIKNDDHEVEKNEIEKPANQAPDLLGLGSLNINSLQALTPVINAMAGLISTNLKSNRRHDVENVTETDNKEVEEQTDSSSDVQNRSPIYIPVRGLADDFEIAESQNIANFDWIEGFQGKNAHESSLLNGGIAISPGEIITANSDVIVGKPGRIGPRIPAIPLHGESEIPIGMKPPPIPNKLRLKQSHEYKRIPAAYDASPSNKVFTSTKDDYIGPPPPMIYPNNDKFKHTTKTIGSQNRKEHFSEQLNPFYQIYSKDQTNYVNDYNLNEVSHFPNQNQQSLRETIQNKFNSMIKQSYPIYASEHESFRVPDQELTTPRNIGPSINNKPIVLPEIIERSTGQPLLVNIQPSQVAFVNIPFNRTTALIYGGSTEPHRNGQYFDDPSPYPEPEFSGVEINNGVPQIASVYQNVLPGQKQVNGVLKVQEQTINIDPDTSANQKVMVNIKPTKPYDGYDDQKVNIGVAPISFGLVHQGDDFNAHVINHGQNNIAPNEYTNLGITEDQRQRWEDFKSRDPYSPSRPNAEGLGHVNKITVETHLNDQKLNANVDPYYKQNPNRYVKGNEIGVNVEMKKPDRERVNALSPVNIWRSEPTRTKTTDFGISETMIPPAPDYQNNHHNYRRPVPIPLGSGSSNNEHQISNLGNTNYGQYPGGERIPGQQQLNQNRIRFPEEENDDDIENGEDGVFQESNSRPLLPGELPIEILKSQASKKNESNNAHAMNYHNETLMDFNRNNYIPVISQNARPFATIQTVPVIHNTYRPDYNHIPYSSHDYDSNINQNVVRNEHSNTVNDDKPSTQYTEDIRVQIPSNNVKVNHNQSNRKQQPNGIKSIIQKTSQKPVLIFIDENNSTTNNFFHHKNQNKFNHQNKISERPSVTSLPIDIQTVEQEVSRRPLNNNRPSQTETPFVPHRNILLDDKFVKNDVTTKAPRYKIRYPGIRPIQPVRKETSDLNTGEVTISSTVSTISDMEILKPPTLKPPAKEIVRIKHYPTGENIPNGVITEASVPKPSSHLPFVPAPLEEMVPPPLITEVKDEVIGMSPPPLTTNIIPHTHNKTVYSMQIDTPKDPTTEKNKYIRTRRPYTRRPSYRTTTTASTTSTTGSTRPTNRRPVFPLGNRLFKNKTSTDFTTTEKNIISPSPSIKTKPSMQVIIGHPNLDIDEIESSSSTSISEATKDYQDSFGSPGDKDAIVEIKPSIVHDTSDLMGVESGIPTEELKKHSSPSFKPDVITHHAGNEVKAVDETTTINSAAASTARSKLLVPTKFVTYTLTSTVTITETTVIESLGKSPSTMTILVTKTERSTIIDTITEVHTLVKPTSIIETVTTTVKQGSSLYPADVYGSPYPSIQVKPTLVIPTISVTNTVSDFSLAGDDDLEEFIIHDDDYPITKEEEPADSNDSILIIMTDKNTKKVIPVPNSTHETQERDEVVPDKVSNVQEAGIFIFSQPEEKREEVVMDRCLPECLASKNELCQKLEGAMKCVCRPGFARMFPDRPCLPTYTFNGKVVLERIGKDALHFYDDLKNRNTSEFLKFAHATREALDRMVMQSDLRDIFHGVQVHSFEPVADSTGIVSKFYLQLSDNIEENRLEQIFQKYLDSNNNSLGGTDIFASSTHKFETADFDECSDPDFHDCSENSRCFNLRGTYTCSCKEGFSDLSENMLYPGRICSADLVGCDRCSFHGTCYTRESNEVLCECFQWYTGESCQINLKVLLIALVTLGIVLFILLLVCVITMCVRRKPRNPGIKFLPQRSGDGSQGTIDRRAMIQDTSSEDSRSETNENLPYVQADKKSKEAAKKTSKVSLQIPERDEIRNTVLFSDQKDRSLTVMIPRARYHPSPATANMMNYTSFDARKPSVPSISNEAKLLNYLDAGLAANKIDPIRKPSNAPTEPSISDQPGSRKTSGALISAGFEVSATVGHNSATAGHNSVTAGHNLATSSRLGAIGETSRLGAMEAISRLGTMETTRGTEADRSENATLIHRISADRLSSNGSTSQFNTLRKSLMDDNIGTSTDWLDIVPRVMAVSEARSFDETTIPPPTRVFRNDFDSKPSSQHQNDEANTMAERDLGSTFLLPHTHLYKPDRRGSDASGFESL